MLQRLQLFFADTKAGLRWILENNLDDSDKLQDMSKQKFVYKWSQGWQMMKSG